jgi:hypothetical protein
MYRVLGGLLVVWGWAQSYTYGNEWYDPTRPYLKLLVAQDRIYRVRASDLGCPSMWGTWMDPALLRVMIT